MSGRLRGRTRMVVLGLVIVGVFVGTTWAWARIPGDDGLIRGCYNRTTGALRVTDPEEGTPPACNASEIAIRWNQRGLRGLRGPIGPPGTTPALYTEVIGSLALDGLPAFEIRAVRLGVSVDVGGGGGSGSGAVVIDDLQVVKGVDAISPQLLELIAMGEGIRTAVLTLTRPGGTLPYLRYLLDDVVLTGLAPMADPVAPGGPLESVALAAGEVRLLAGAGNVAALPDPVVGFVEVEGFPGFDMTAYALQITSQAPAGGGGGGARPEFGLVEVTGQASSRTASYFLAALEGTMSRTATVSVTGDPVIVLEDVAIGRVVVSSDGVTGRPPTMSVAFGYRSLTESAGGASYCFDIAQAQVC